MRHADREQPAVVGPEPVGVAGHRQQRLSTQDVEALLGRVQVLVDGAGGLELDERKARVDRADMAPDERRAP